MKKMIVTGNVGRDPEMRADQTGNMFATFSIGVSVGTKQNPKTDWIDISCNDKLADLAKNYIKKGSKLLIEGFPTAHAYIDKENKAVGVMRLTARNIEFIGNAPHDDSTSSHAQQTDEEHSEVYKLPESTYTDTVLKSDDIPF